MFDQSYGLRFDIYERIILAEDLPGIEELEEAELIPHIQVIHQGEQAALRGHLLLAGLYKGDTPEQETEPLEHWIPVEITVPMNRVSSLEDIAVEIENFDVDVLSKRGLNITGVLSLKGIQGGVQGYGSDQAWQDEEISVVHAPADSQQQEEEARREASQEVYTANSFEAVNEPAAAEPELEAVPRGAAETTNESKADSTPLTAESTQADAAAPVPSVWSFERQQSGWPEELQDEERQDEKETAEPEQAAETVEHTPDTLETEAEQPETIALEGGIQESAELQEEEVPAKPELKVAFSSKNSTVSSTGSAGFSSLLHPGRLTSEGEAASIPAEEPAANEPERQAGEDVQWKSLFLGARQEETPFRKVRLCIVQREETLEGIAERYQLSPRELLLYNRLSEQSVEEGQILYIP
ncbi:peptidoglycan-binding lysin domain-containing protein [Paenibacillus algicola]|uniref:Peptidoglycan-binding lysin domain-containing protein n=1 Tax=Paenibacillus algicola TaxID=2565926 RepID=A0A4P8XI28_9BACL|nr:LysM peptidoglycan-binding domain-containing protein [Paenibacillus algicola]QCT01968.1 peptidoglycan-binding lysin domain-containing protein [Paenibacillus algicola]